MVTASSLVPIRSGLIGFMRHNKAGSAFAASLLSTVACPSIALAQAAPSGAPDDNGSHLQEIVVTAQHRSENMQNVPISVSAFNGQTLKSGGVTSVLELGHIDPSVQTNFNTGAAYPFVRGIGNMATGVVGNEGSVAVYVDDFYYTRLYSSIVGLGSIDQVEVLKGPQGTLFGRNASGGAIQMFTKDPGSKTEGDVSIGYANYDTFSGSGYFSTPVTDNLFWNVAVAGSDQKDGWGHSILTGQDEYLGSNWTIRSKLVWEPTDRTKIKLVGYYAYQNDDFGTPKDYREGTYGGTTDFYSSPTDPAVPGYPNPATILPSLANSGGFYDSRLAYRQMVRVSTYGASLRIDQKLGFANLVSISGFKNTLQHEVAQVNFDSPNWENLPLRSPDNEVTQEIQLKSKASSKISWILGGFYMHYFSGYQDAVFSGDVFNLSVAPDTKERIYGLQTINSYSTFGQATVPITYNTNLTVGLRYTDDELSGKGAQYLVIPGEGEVSASGEGIDNPYHNSKSFQRVTYKVALDHHFSSDLMAYASISRGYKAGTYNTLPLQSSPAKPEIVDAYEIGLKTELLDRRIRLNGDLFWNDIKDPQVQTILVVGNAAGVGLINAQKARTRGAEISLNAVATKGLELRVNAAYLDAKYLRFTNGALYVGGLNPEGPVLSGPYNYDFSGYRMPNAPHWRVDFGANYTVNSALGKFVVDAGASYSSKYTEGASFQYSNIWEKSRTLVNASLNFSPASLPHITMGLWGKNLSNVKYYVYSESNVYGDGAGGWRGVAGAPRTFGGTVSYKF